jgi:hypothetical protein
MTFSVSVLFCKKDEPLKYSFGTITFFHRRLCRKTNLIHQGKDNEA